MQGPVAPLPICNPIGKEKPNDRQSFSAYCDIIHICDGSKGNFNISLFLKGQKPTTTFNLIGINPKYI